MEKLNVFYDKISVKTNIDLIDKVLQVYAILNFEDPNHLVDSQRKVLLHYVLKGISEDTFKEVIEDTGYRKAYLHNLNKTLRDKGYLVRDTHNDHKFHLNPQLEQIRKKFITDKAKGYIISFERH